MRASEEGLRVRGGFVVDERASERASAPGKEGGGRGKKGEAAREERERERETRLQTRTADTRQRTCAYMRSQVLTSELNPKP